MPLFKKKRKPLAWITAPTFLLEVKRLDDATIKWCETFRDKDEAVDRFWHMAKKAYPESVFDVKLFNIDRGRFKLYGRKQESPLYQVETASKNLATD